MTVLDESVEQVPTSAAPTTAAPTIEVLDEEVTSVTLPRTGSSSDALALGGAALVALGGLLVVGSRRVAGV